MLGSIACTKTAVVLLAIALMLLAIIEILVSYVLLVIKFFQNTLRNSLIFTLKIARNTNNLGMLKCFVRGKPWLLARANNSSCCCQYLSGLHFFAQHFLP